MMIDRLQDLSNRLRDSGRYAADECDLVAASLIDDAKLTILGQEQGLEIMRDENEQLRAALQRFVTAAKSWHDFHHGSETVQCDWLCECIPAAERALGGIPEHPQAPIAKVTVKDGMVARTGLYAPGLPDGEHDLYCEPESVAPYMRQVQPNGDV